MKTILLVFGIIILITAVYFAYVYFTKKSLSKQIQAKCGKSESWEGSADLDMKLNICQLKKVLNNCSVSTQELETCGKLPFIS